MTAPSILGPSGLPLVELSGERAWKQFTKGDVVVSLQWIDLKASNPDYDEEGAVPCMCLFHAHRRALGTSAYVIPQSAAFRYIGGDGKPTFWFRNAVAMAVLEMGFGPNDKAAITRVLDCLYEYLPELFAMSTHQPEALDVKRQVEGIEATFKVNGKTQHQELL